MEGESTSLLQDRSRYEVFEMEDQSELVSSDDGLERADSQDDSIDEQVEYFRNAFRYWKQLLTKPLLLLVLNVSIIIVTNLIHHHLQERSHFRSNYHDRSDDDRGVDDQQYKNLEELYFAEFERDASWYLQLINIVLALLFAVDTIILLGYIYGLIQTIGDMRSELIHLNSLIEEKEKCQLGTEFSLRYTDALFATKFESMLRTGSCPNESKRYALVNLLHFAACVCLIGFFQHLAVLTILHFGLIKENDTICSPAHLFHIETYVGGYYGDVLVEVNQLEKIPNILPKDLFEATTSADALRLEYGTKVVFAEKKEYYHSLASEYPSFASLNDGFTFFETWKESRPGGTSSLKVLDKNGKYINVPTISRSHRWGFEGKLGFRLQKENRLCYAFQPDSEDHYLNPNVYYGRHIDLYMFCHCSGTFSSYFHNISMIDEKFNDRKIKDMIFLGYKLSFTDDDTFWTVSMFDKITPNPTSMSYDHDYRHPNIHENPFPRNVTQVFSKYDICTMKKMERVEVTLQINPVIDNEKHDRHNRGHDVCTDALDKVLLHLCVGLSPFLIVYSCWKRFSVTPLLIFLPIGISFQIQVYKHEDRISTHFAYLNSFIEFYRPVLLVAIIVLQIIMISSLTLGYPRISQKLTRDGYWWSVYGIIVMMFLFLILDNEAMDDGMGPFIMVMEILCILWIKILSEGPILKIAVVTTMVISVFRMLDRDSLDYDCIECWIIVFFSVSMWFPLVAFVDSHKPMAKLLLRSCLQSLKPKAQRFLNHFSMIDALQKRLSRRNSEQNE
ncbi:predicted protein [Chaetoceros tenuissimus]|uniref:Uncharacterized protein n=1 Tax=Chaetoceros tenuissimus TaxID=426638 RepID=A0AAD3D1P4_9STRA|nr:predicted protein [Chaetoceros tenuissimus]